MRRTSSKKNWLLIAFAAVGASVLLLVYSEKFGDLTNLSGTMARKTTVAFENVTASWGDGTGSESTQGGLDDVFNVSFSAANQTEEIKQESVSLYFSRDNKFSLEDDCKIEEQRIVMEPMAESAVAFRSAPRLVNCLDAGPWYVAVHSENGGWKVLEQVYEVESGYGALEIESIDKEVAARGTLSVRMQVHRQTVQTGFDGLYDFPVDVWLSQGKTLCLIEADAIAVPRDPAAHWNQSWMATPMALTVDLKKAKSVEASSVSTSPFNAKADLESARNCKNCAPPKLEGSCKLSEGPLKVTAGPTLQGFQVVQETYHHASPVVIETGSVKVSVHEGEVVHVSRTAYNPGLKSVRWSSKSVNGEDWIVGMSNQQLPAKKPSEVGFTVSAVDLEAGVYEATVRVTSNDFYKSETIVKVEVTVLPTRNVVREEAEVPGSFSLSNYPNPFNPTTTIRFELPQSGQVTLSVFDMTGRRVQVLQDGELSSGVHEVRFDAGDLPSGTYLYRLSTPTLSKTEKMILVK